MKHTMKENIKMGLLIAALASILPLAFAYSAATTPPGTGATEWLNAAWQWAVIGFAMGFIANWLED